MPTAVDSGRHPGRSIARLSPTKKRTGRRFKLLELLERLPPSLGRYLTIRSASTSNSSMLKGRRMTLASEMASTPLAG